MKSSYERSTSVHSEKHMTRFWLVLSCILGACLAARTNAGTASVPLQAIDPAALQRDVKWLSSSDLRGRLTMQPGNKRAASWIEWQFLDIGLDPVPMDGERLDYRQAIPLYEFRQDFATTELSINGERLNRTVGPPEIYVTSAEDLDIAGQLVFAGYGISAPQAGYDDYEGIDAIGKIVLVWDHEPRETDPASVFNGTGNTIYASNYVKALNAQKHGAIAVLHAPEPLKTHPTAQEIRQRIGHQAARAHDPIPVHALQRSELRIPSVIISAGIARDLFEQAGLDPADRQKQMDRTLQSGAFEFPDLRFALRTHVKTRQQGTAWNIVGMLRGQDGALASETVIVSAHYDHDGASGERIWHGADDNASGVAGLIAIAKALTHAERPKRSILFVAFGAEERGMLGSHYYVQNPLRSLDSTRAVVNLDMIGRVEADSPQTRDIVVVPADERGRLNLIGAAFSAGYRCLVERRSLQFEIALDDKFDHDHALNLLSRSDHFPFLLRAIPAVWWTTGFHPDYHQTSDTAEKIDYPLMRKVVAVAANVTLDLANADKPPDVSMLGSRADTPAQGGRCD